MKAPWCQSVFCRHRHRRRRALSQPPTSALSIIVRLPRFCAPSAHKCARRLAASPFFLRLRPTLSSMSFLSRGGSVPAPVAPVWTSVRWLWAVVVVAVRSNTGLLFSQRPSTAAPDVRVRPAGLPGKWMRCIMRKVPPLETLSVHFRALATRPHPLLLLGQPRGPWAGLQRRRAPSTRAQPTRSPGCTRRPRPRTARHARRASPDTLGTLPACARLQAARSHVPRRARSRTGRRS